MGLKNEVVVLTYLRLVHPMRQDVETLGGFRQPRNQLPALALAAAAAPASAAPAPAYKCGVIENMDTKKTKTSIGGSSSASALQRVLKAVLIKLTACTGLA